ncbi:hypothetical protein B0H13DRAFT_2295082 [Mycena leptocephala]|nr:hypothetical protein B0H13DRAFT_2295082 [Mycena leptocephala]
MSEKLTAAQKGAATRVEKAARQRQEDIEFIAAHSMSSVLWPFLLRDSDLLPNWSPSCQTGHPKKCQYVDRAPMRRTIANFESLVWNGQASTSRKRTSSTTQASKTTKKASETTTEADQEDEEPVEESQVKLNSVSRKYAAPPININSDSDSEPEPKELKKVPLVRIDFTDFSSPKAKAKTAKAAPKAKPTKIVNVPVKAKVAVTRKPVKMVADSASEAEDNSQPSGDEDFGDADNSDESDAEDDAGPNAQEFVDEVLQVICARARATAADADEEDQVSETEAGLEGFQSDQSHELDVIAPKPKGKGIKKSVKPAEDLFASEEEEAAPMSRRSIWAQAHRRTGSRQSVNSGSDIMMDEAIADELRSVPLYTHSRRGSTASGWSSGRDLTILTSEPESDAASEPEVLQPRKKNKVSVARQKKADLEKPEVRPAPAPPVGIGANSGNGGASRPESSWDTSTQLSHRPAS